VADDLSEYCRFATDLGLHSELRVSIGPDVVAELRLLCVDVAHEFPQGVFFAGKLIFEAEGESFLSRFLHNHTALELQKFLQVHGLSLVILPVRVIPSAVRRAAEMVGQSRPRLLRQLRPRRLPARHNPSSRP
jgi:hypothetical protein